MQYLFEINKINYTANEILSELQFQLNIYECDIPFGNVIEESIKHTWTSDPFDRIIVAQASLNNSILLTRDRIILKQYKYAIW